jgi:hypothetical protein
MTTTRLDEVCYVLTILDIDQEAQDVLIKQENITTLLRLWCLVDRNLQAIELQHPGMLAAMDSQAILVFKKWWTDYLSKHNYNSPDDIKAVFTTDTWEPFFENNITLPQTSPMTSSGKLPPLPMPWAMRTTFGIDIHPTRQVLFPTTPMSSVMSPMDASTSANLAMTTNINVKPDLKHYPMFARMVTTQMHFYSCGHIAHN